MAKKNSVQNKVEMVRALQLKKQEEQEKTAAAEKKVSKEPNQKNVTENELKKAIEEEQINVLGESTEFAKGSKRATSNKHFNALVEDYELILDQFDEDDSSGQYTRAKLECVEMVKEVRQNLAKLGYKTNAMTLTTYFITVGMMHQKESLMAIEKLANKTSKSIKDLDFLK